MARFDPRLVQYNAAQTQQFYQLLLERVRDDAGRRERGAHAEPAARARAISTASPSCPTDFRCRAIARTSRRSMDTVDEGYFSTMGIPIVRGRGFRASDTADAPRVAVVNEQFANHYWPGADPVGKHIRLDGATGTPVEIVGVAETVKYRDTGEKRTDFVYLPLASASGRADGSAGALERRSAAARQCRHRDRPDLDPNLPMLTIRSYEDLYRYSTVEGPRVAIELVGTMGAVGLLLAIAGLYGLVAYNVAQRTREIGIRIAIGATTGRRAAPGHGQGPHPGRSRHGDRPGDGVRRRAADERDAVQRRRHRSCRICRRRAVPVCGDDAGGLRAGAASIQDRANAGAAVRVDG